MNDNEKIRKEIAAVREEVRAVLSWVRFIGWTLLIIVSVILWPMIVETSLLPIVLVVVLFLVLVNISMRLSPKKPEGLVDVESSKDEE